MVPEGIEGFSPMLIPRLKLQDFSSLRKILQDATEMLNSNKANLSSIVGGRLPDFLRESVVGSVNEKRPSNTADRLQLSEISPSARSSEVRLLTRSKAPGFEKPGLLLNRVDQGRGGTALRSQPCSGVGECRPHRLLACIPFALANLADHVGKF